MATYYYANVSRYQNENNGLRAEYVVENTRITAANLKTNTKYYVYYIIDIYASSISTFSAWAATGNTDQTYDGKLVSSNASTNEKNNLANGLTTNVTASANANADQVKYVTQGALTNDNSHNKVSFNRKGGATNGQVIATPTVSAQWKSDASPNWTKITGINYGTPNNVAPSITWTTVVTPPVFPFVAIQAVIKAQYGEDPIRQSTTVTTPNKITISNNYVWDKCNGGLWHFVVNFKTAQYGGNGSQEHWTCTKNGDQCRSVSGPPSAEVLGTKAKLIAWTKKNITDPMIAAKSNAACNDTSAGSGNGLKDIAAVTPPAGDTRWNPPSHRDARDISHGERQAMGDNINSITAFAEKERGRIFQDANSAAVLNKSAQGLKDAVASKIAINQWGFRFMYNPSTFAYQSTSNNAVDWTLGSSDPATLLSGNSQVSFEVYINRIPDLKYLRLKNPQISENQLYGRPLKPEEREGILNRGTEYDIEFLYRVLNGDPLKNSLLLSSKYAGATADFGYTTGVPCWLVLNENLRYYGSVASFNVNHAMFDLNMVPILSTVSITFARYPALWNQTVAFGDKVSVASTKEYLKNNGKAPG
jgi:hypothetical protein